MSVPNSVGTTKTQSTLFNTGILTINGTQIGEITNIAPVAKKTEKNFYSLNSILKRAIRDSQVDMNLSFDMEGGLYRDLFAAWFAQSSAVGSGLQYNVLDGQPTAPTVYITCYENGVTTTAYQIVIQNPLILTHNLTLAAQSFAKVKVEIACTTWTMYVDNTVAN